MTSIQAYDLQGKKVTTWQIGTEGLVNGSPALLSQAIRIYTSNSHQKTHKVKTRGEVDGSTKKIFRQKGTGNARHGARYAPIFVGGGIAHGPDGVRPANMVLPKKMRSRALASALLEKLAGSAMSGVTAIQTADGKTSSAAHFLSAVAGHPKSKVLVVTFGRQTKLYQMLGNLQGVSMKRAGLVNAYDLVAHDSVVITKKALEAIVSRASRTVKKA